MKNVFLFKLTANEFLESNLDGNLYMNTYDHYRKTEEKINRGDKQEGVASSFPAENIEGITVNNSEGNPIPIGGLKGRVNFMSPYDHQVNIFCMSIFELKFLSEPTSFNYKLDNRFIGFGDKVILITQPQEFIDKIIQSLKGKKSAPSSNKFFDKVNYLPVDYCGNMNSFCKLKEYEWQNEWRVAILDPTRNKPMPVTLEIGDIRSISIVFDTEYLINTGLQVSMNNPHVNKNMNA